MSSYAPIAYTYEADTHCPSCAESRFGLDDDGFIPEDAEDGEGNPIGAISPLDEWWSSDGECEVLACGDCHEELDRAHAGACVYSDVDLCTVEGSANVLEGLEQADDYFDVAQGLYWFCADYHGGQSSAEYSILSTLGYRPAAAESSPTTEVAMTVYRSLAAGLVDLEVTRDYVEAGYALAH